MDMTRSIVMVGNESPAFAALRAESLSRVDRIVCAYLPSRLATPTPGPDKMEAADPSRITVLPLPSTSPLSCHALMLDVANKAGPVSEFFLVFSPLSLRSPIKDLRPADIDRLCDDLLKSWFFLAREALRLLSSQGTGKLCLVLSDEISPDGGGEEPDLVGPVLSAAFKALVDGLLGQTPSDQVQILAFGAHETAGIHSLATHCFKILDEDKSGLAGRWHRAGKQGLFSPRK